MAAKCSEVLEGEVSIEGEGLNDAKKNPAYRTASVQAGLPWRSGRDRSSLLIGSDMAGARGDPLRL